MTYVIDYVDEKLMHVLFDNSNHDFFCWNSNCATKRNGTTISNGDPETGKTSLTADGYRSRLDKAGGFSQIWEIVKDAVQDSLGENRGSMMLFLDDLPIHLGAYHPLGTNNIVLNRTLIQIVEAATKSKRLVNAFVYSLLVHEYIHALGHVSEADARNLVYEISKKCFGEDHIATRLAKESPWTLLRDIPLNAIEMPKRVMEIVKDFEKSNQKYIV
ncbi:MAG: hypothetical protein OEX77_01410 [Candidatus Bathyarchaeota archaeon]|nr:hypothetical protein [Candidatus Bathyarchaeota archaeon]MDH5732584.1 hypothetical protein [Candidatus Bathyarchaeota archaeon]